MENVKNLRLLAVDTSLGTNFLLSACEDATISELRGMIQKEHMSCFPEHESITVGALLVDYSEKQYHVTDHLLIGQVFSNGWNKIHAVVSSGSARTALFSNSPKPIKIQSLAEEKLGIPGGCLDDRPFVKCTGALQNAKSKSLNFDRQSESVESPTHAVLCQTKVLANCVETVPAKMVNQDWWIDREKYSCPLFSFEAPYTQPHSELNVSTRVSLSKGVLEYKSKRKRRKHVDLEIPVKKQKQGEMILCGSARDGESSPDNVSASSTKEEPQAGKHEESLERDDFNSKVALSKGDEHLINASEEPNNNCLQHIGGINNYLKNGREQGENFLFTETETFVSNPGRMNFPSMIPKSHLNPVMRANEEARSCKVQKKNTGSSSSEKGFSNSTRKREEHISQMSDKTELKGCPEMSAGNLQKVTEEAFMDDGVQLHDMDLSRGYPIQLNDRTILLVASLSTDVVPETQESQVESQDGVLPGGEGALEQPAVEPLYGCLEQEHHPSVDSVVCQEMEALGLPLPLNQDTKNMDAEALNCQVEEENLKLKPLPIADQPEESNAVIEARKLCDGHHDASCSGDSHNFSVHGKRKKYRRRKVSQIDVVLMQEDGGFVGVNNEQQGAEGDAGPQKMIKSLIETSNGKLESLGKLDVIERSRDPASARLETNERKASKVSSHRKWQKQIVDSCNTSFPIEGKHITEAKNVSIEHFLRTDGGERIEGSSMEGCNTTIQESLCEKERTGKTSNRTRRKKKKRRKGPTSDHHNDAGINNIRSNHEADPVYACVNNIIENDSRPSLRKENKESLPNALGLAAAIAEDELKQGDAEQDKTMGSVQVAERKSKRKKKVNMDTDVEMGFLQEQDQNVVYANVNDMEPLSKDGIAESTSPDFLLKESPQRSLLKDRIVTSSSPGSPLKKSSEEGLIITKQGFDAFEFESGETLNRLKENFTDLEATSNLRSDNLDKLCSVAVDFVADDETLSPSKPTTRKSSRKTVHPKRWITVLSERLTWNPTSKSSSKKQHANKKRRRKTKVEMPGDGDLTTEACYAEEDAEGSSQILVDDGRIACPFGCGRLYSKKTSAYYRHCKKCSGSDF